MNIETLDKLKQLLHDDAAKHGDNIFFVENGTPYTGNELADHIKNETEFGLNVISDILNLSLTLLSSKNTENKSYNEIDSLVESKKEQLVNLVVNSRLTKLEKVKLLTKYKLYPIEPWLAHPFNKFDTLKDKISDDYFDLLLQRQIIDKYQTVYFADYLQDLNDEIVVMTYRSSDYKVKITKKEFIEVLCDYVLENKVIGFKCDW